MTEQIEVLIHSSIRLTTNSTIYVDPFRVEGEPHDADFLFFTHDHFDHFSPEDIQKAGRPDTTLVLPESMREKAAGIPCGGIITVVPGMALQLADFSVETVAAYNQWKPFHPKKNGWVGYIFTLDGVRIYIAGDTDVTPENQVVRCDVALVPIGGTYTMDAKKAAALVNTIRPKVAVPIHYGSIVGQKSDEEIFRSLVDRTIQVEIKMQRYS